MLGSGATVGAEVEKRMLHRKTDRGLVDGVPSFNNEVNPHMRRSGESKT